MTDALDLNPIKARAARAAEPVGTWLEGVLRMAESANDVQVLIAEIEKVRTERDLALAHDTQPYPTAWAYEQACKVIERQKAEIKRLEDEINWLAYGRMTLEQWQALANALKDFE